MIRASDLGKINFCSVMWVDARWMCIAGEKVVGKMEMALGKSGPH